VQLLTRSDVGLCRDISVFEPVETFDRDVRVGRVAPIDHYVGFEALLNVSGCDEVAEKQRKEGEKQHRSRFIFCLICELVFAKYWTYYRMQVSLSYIYIYTSLRYTSFPLLISRLAPQSRARDNETDLRSHCSFLGFKVRRRNSIVAGLRRRVTGEAPLDLSFTRYQLILDPVCKHRREGARAKRKR
jgi:hypothetical protein